MFQNHTHLLLIENLHLLISQNIKKCDPKLASFLKRKIERLNMKILKNVKKIEVEHLHFEVVATSQNTQYICFIDTL